MELSTFKLQPEKMAIQAVNLLFQIINTKQEERGAIPKKDIKIPLVFEQGETLL